MIWFFRFGLFDIQPLQSGKSFLKIENQTNRKTGFLFFILMILIKNKKKSKTSKLGIFI